MIFSTYPQFRFGFNPTATFPDDYAADGFPLWPRELLDDPAFTGDLVFHSGAVFPYQISVDGTLDPTPGLDRYDWYVSQRSDVYERQYFYVQRDDVSISSTRSGRIKLVLSYLADVLYPDPLTVAAQIVLFKDLDVYVRRRSDGLIQHRLLSEVVFT